MRTTPKLDRRYLHVYLLVFFVLVGLALRLIRLDFQPLWWDEGYSVWFAGHPLLEMARLTAADIHPPLYYALLHGWSQALGLLPAPLRLFSVLVSLPAIPLAYVLGRDLHSRRAGLVAAGLVALNPLAIFYGQEIRMYGLATTFSFLALWTGWRWVQPSAPRRFGVVYALALAGGFYTLYYFALLPLAQFVWVLVAARSRLRPWLAAALAAVLVYVPWLLYAGPKLLNYVAYKVVQDNDTPLALLPYTGRHLSAFLAGHLEGPLAPLWPWVLILLAPLAAALLWPQSNASWSPTRGRPSNRALLYLALALFVPLIIGFIQQRRAPFLPDRFERVLLFAAPVFWVLVAIALDRLAQRSTVAAVVLGASILAVNAAALAAFYTVPRYRDHDYRPLIAQVGQAAAPGDSVFAIFPWQVGYFWSYLSTSDRPRIVLSPASEWGPALKNTLDDLLHQGTVWFPEHLALGAILETAAETHLDEQSHQLLNRWYGASTRLTAWVQPAGTGAGLTLASPVPWQNGVTLVDARIAPAESPAANTRFLLDLTWQGDRPIDVEHTTLSLWLQDGQGYRWTQRDVNPFAQPYPPLDGSTAPWENADRIAMALPAGVPPGPYELMAALLDASGRPISLAGQGANPSAALGAVTVTTPSSPVSLGALPIQTPIRIQGDGVTFLGSSHSDGAYLPGDDLAVSLFWLPQGPLDPDRHFFLQLLDKEGRPVANSEGPPLASYPTSTWAPGIPMQTQHRLRIPAGLPPGDYALIAGLFDPATGERVQWDGADFLSLAKLQTKARVHSFTPASPQHALDLSLQGGHRLAGYDLETVNGGEAATLTLYWQPAGATDVRYSTFVHLVGPDGAILAQSDREPADGAHPTTSWVAGESVTDTHTLTLPPGAVDGRYRLQFGLYDPSSDRRLPFVDAAGAVIADHAEVRLP